jgi:copper(I)-binding protein
VAINKNNQTRELKLTERLIPMKKLRTLIAIAAVAIFATTLTACGDSESDSGNETEAVAETEVAAEETEESTETSQVAASITIEEQWARTSPMDSTVGAAYMNIVSNADDALVGASVDTSIAMMTQVHETTKAADGSMGMKEIAALPLPAGIEVELKPGGYHIMMMKLAKPLVVGESIDITLTFESGATQVVTVPVLAEEP